MSHLCAVLCLLRSKLYLYLTPKVYRIPVSFSILLSSPCLQITSAGRSWNEFLQWSRDPITRLSCSMYQWFLFFKKWIKLIIIIISQRYLDFMRNRCMRCNSRWKSERHQLKSHLFQSLLLQRGDKTCRMGLYQEPQENTYQGLCTCSDSTVQMLNSIILRLSKFR